MKIIFQLTILTYLSFLTYSCSSKDDSKSLKEQVTIDDMPIELLGTYSGIQPSYALKNKSGEDMIINGEIVPVPTSTYIFLIKGNHEIHFQQMTKERFGNSSHITLGEYKVINIQKNTVEIECLFNSGNGSNPKYIIVLNKTNNSAICIGTNEPEIKLQKK